jgi:hypothetical protein
VKKKSRAMIHKQIVSRQALAETTMQAMQNIDGRTAIDVGCLAESSVYKMGDVFYDRSSDQIQYQK